MPNPTDLFQHITHRINPNATLRRAWPLTGGVSVHVTALAIAFTDGQIIQFIVRQHGQNDRAANPNVAADEFKLLGHLKSAGLPVPTPHLVDEGCTILDTPYIVIDYIDGQTDFAPSHLDDFLGQFATTLAHIHQISNAPQALAFLPSQNALYSGKFNCPAHHNPVHAPILATLATACPLKQHNPSTLLHGDFWPGNVLWKDGQLVGVVDWEDAKIGDPLADVANSRLEILWAFGVDAMQTFTELYHSLSPIDLSNLPYWDLVAALKPTEQFADWAAGWVDYGRPDVTGQTLHDGHKWFIQHALDRLSTP